MRLELRPDSGFLDTLFRPVAWALAALLGLTGCGSPNLGPVTPQYDGRQFTNPGHVKSSSVAGYLWLRVTGAQAPWPDSVAVPPSPPPPARVDGPPMRVTLVGHATVLIQVAGLNILTDPVWSERASPLSFVGPKRVTAPGVSLPQLPKIDLVLISHDHYDHLDLPTLRQLDARDRPRVVVPLGNRALVASAMPASIVTEHDWGTQVGLAGGASVHVEPLLHGSGRTPLDQMHSLWAAYVIKAGGYTVYHAGDTGYGDGRLFREAGNKHGGFDLAILPIGAYEPVSFMADSHMSPAEAVKAKADLRAARAMAHHFGAFQLGFEAFDAPRRALRAALAASQIPPEQFPALEPGQALVLQAPRAP
jgi:L-ascorbate metabolism protein UlaG (beta-lactamase superfamily)